MIKTCKSILSIVAVIALCCVSSRQILTNQAARAAADLIYPSCGNIKFNTSIPVVNRPDDLQVYNVSMLTLDTEAQITDYYRNFSEDDWKLFGETKEWVGGDTATILGLSQEDLRAYVYIVDSEDVKTAAIFIFFEGIGK